MLFSPFRGFQVKPIRNGMITEVLIRQCIVNDRKAQKAIYEQLYGGMLSLCRRYVGDEDTAKELVNIGFLKVFKHIHDFTFKGSFEGWVRRIMVNVSLDELKRSKVRSTLFINIDDSVEYGESNVYNEAIQKLHMSDLYALIEKISPVSRAVFNMYVIDGYSHKEIAEQMNISIGTSKWHVSNARSFLQHEIGKLYDETLKKIV